MLYPLFSSAILFISTFNISSFIISILLKLDNVSFRIGIRVLSISTAMTFLAFLARQAVRVPIPGPISITISSLDILADDTILSKTSWSIKKFCPKFFLNAKLYLFIISLVLKANVLFSSKLLILISPNFI